MRKQTLFFASTALLSVSFLTGHAQASAGFVPPLHAPASEQVKLYINDNIQQGAENFIETLTKRGISFLSNAEMTHTQRKKEFEKLLNDTFDIKTIARFSLGRYWRVATPSERDEYFGLFKKMIVDVYSERFGEYQGQSIEVTGSAAQGKNDVIVNSVLVSDDGPEVNVDWRVRYKNGQYKVVDVIVEGVSMSLTQRSDFASVIQRGGGKVDVLLAHMER